MLTSEVVTAYLHKNVVPADSLAYLINTVHGSLAGLSFKAEEMKTTALVPAVPVKKSLKADAITCLECGVQYKSLKRHLISRHQQTDDQYRERWGLPSDYPMVAPDYAQARSNLAKQTGLGRNRSKAARARRESGT
jgi:predicted transcriptional regulator